MIKKYEISRINFRYILFHLLWKKETYIYIRVPNLIIEGITFQWIPRPDRKARPLIRVTHRNTTKFNLSGMSAHRDNEQRGLTNGLHVTPNNKVARFSSGWIAVNIVDGHQKEEGVDRLQLCALQIDIISRIGPRPAAFPRIGILISPSASFLRSFLSLSLPSSFSTRVQLFNKRAAKKGGGGGAKKGEKKEGRRSTRECVPGLWCVVDVGCRANVFIKRRKLLTLRISERIITPPIAFPFFLSSLFSSSQGFRVSSSR